MPKTLNDQFVLVAGTGYLPKLVLETASAAGGTPVVLTLPGTRPADFPGVRCLSVNLGNYVEILRSLSREGLRQLVLAGGVRRPPSPSEGAADIWDGDDSAIRNLLTPVEALGFDVVGVQEIIPELLVTEGAATSAQPSESDRRDAGRAAAIVSALGRVDVGQAAVVVRGICVAVESATGTDRMLSSVGPALAELFPGQAERMGLLFKAPKPGQDMRVDVPVIGPATIRGVAEAGLRGIAVQSGGVMLLQRSESIELANSHGLFIWGVPEESG